METRKKQFADSCWYAIIRVVLAILLILAITFVVGGLSIGVVYLIIRSADTIGGWWILLMSLYISLMAAAGFAIVLFRRRQGIRGVIGDELYFVTHGGALCIERTFERLKRRLKEIFTHTSQEKSKYEQLLDRCAAQRLSEKKKRKER